MNEERSRETMDRIANFWYIYEFNTCSQFRRSQNKKQPKNYSNYKNRGSVISLKKEIFGREQLHFGLAEVYYGIQKGLILHFW